MRCVKAAGAIIVVLFGALASCKKSDDSPGARQMLVGTWDTDFAAYDADTDRVLTEHEKAYFPASSHLLYTFSDSGTLAIREGNSTPDLYTWNLSSNGTSLQLIPQTDTADRLYYHLYRLTATSLILEDTGTNGTLSWTGLVK